MLYVEINVKNTLKGEALGTLHLHKDREIYLLLTNMHQYYKTISYLLSFGTNCTSLLFTFTGKGSTRHFLGGALL